MKIAQKFYKHCRQKFIDYTSCPNDSCDIFINKFTKIYDQAFP